MLSARSNRRVPSSDFLTLCAVVCLDDLRNGEMLSDGNRDDLFDEFHPVDIAIVIDYFLVDYLHQSLDRGCC